MKLIDKVKERVKDVVEDYFTEKQGDYEYKYRALEHEVKDVLEFRLEEIMRELGCLDDEIDDLLDDDQIPTREQQMNDYDTWRENELANERR